MTGEDVSRTIRDLIGRGFLRCEGVGAAGCGDFPVYTGYDCVTSEQHHEKFGYGPHESAATEESFQKLRRDAPPGYLS